MWHVYILECKDRSLYTGITTDLARRLKEHNSKKGAAYTRCRLPVKVVYSESRQNRSQALRRENEIKALSKKEKMLLLCRDKS